MFERLIGIFVKQTRKFSDQNKRSVHLHNEESKNLSLKNAY